MFKQNHRGGVKMSNTNELQHHGIPGQKWGVRRYQNRDGSLTRAGKKRQQMSQDAREAKALKKKKVREMSNADLRKLNERQNLERTHKQLNPNAVAKGAKVVAVTAAGLGTIVSIKKNGGKVIEMGKTAVKTIFKR